MSSRYLTRWVLCPRRDNGQAKVLDYCDDVVTVRSLATTPELLICECRFQRNEVALMAAQRDTELLIIGAQSVRATRETQRVKDWLTTQGIELDADDTGTNVVRKIRDKLTAPAVGERHSFVVSD